MRRPALAAAGLGALALMAPLLAQGQQSPYTVPTPTPTPTAPAPAMAPAPAKPSLGRAVVLELVSGKIGYRVPGAKEQLLTTTPVRVPMHTVVDALHGRVRVVVARNRTGGRWRSVFFDGRFSVRQAELTRAVTQITLLGGRFKDCTKASVSRVRRSHRRIRRLWGDGHGRFRTVGRYSAATVRGTKWEVEDRCDGTLTRVARGVVDVEDFTVPPPPPSGGSGGGENVTGGGGGGGGQNGSQAPTAAPAPQAAKPRHVSVSKGQTYVASPGG